jgi:hypothetical protein
MFYYPKPHLPIPLGRVGGGEDGASLSYCSESAVVDWPSPITNLLRNGHCAKSLLYIPLYIPCGLFSRIEWHLVETFEVTNIYAVRVQSLFQYRSAP